jgi:hypothetical protein
MAHSITTDSLPPPIHIAQFNEQLHARYGSTKALVFRAFGPSVSVGNHLVSLLQQVKDTVGGCDLFEVELSFRNLEYLSDLQSPPFKKCVRPASSLPKASLTRLGGGTPSILGSSATTAQAFPRGDNRYRS